MSDWNPIDDPVDYVVLGGKRTPGLAEIVDASSPRGWDERKGMGMSGAICVFTGRELAKFAIRIRLCTPQDWLDWYAFAPTVMKFPRRRGMGGGGGKDSGMLDIEHPYTVALDIKAVGVVEVMQPEQTADGEWTITIKLIEFRQPRFALAKPEGAEATPVDPVEEEIIKPLMQRINDQLAEEG